METKDYSDLLPLDPPEGAMEWMKRQGAFPKEYMIYRAEYYHDPLTGEKVKGVRVRCTACGYDAIERYVPADCCGRGYAPAPFGFFNSVYLEDVISGRCTVCPECGAKLEARHIGAMPGGIMQEAWCMTVGRVEDKLALLGWLFRRHIDKEGKSDYWTLPYEAYVIEEKRIVRLMGYQKCLSSVSLFGHWEQRKQYLDVWGLAPRILPWDPALLEGSTAENSKLDLYLAAAGDSPFPVSYLRFWQKRPAVENLVMQGAGHLVATMIENECSRYSYQSPKACPKLESINWKEKRPAQMLGLNKDEFRVCAEQKWTQDELEVYKELRGAEPVRLPEDMALIRKHGAAGAKSLLKHDKARGKHPVMRCLRYLERQINRQGTGGVKMNAGYLLDYWAMAKELEEDLRDTSIRFPKDLRHQHDRLNEERVRILRERELKEREKEIESRKEAFGARMAQLAPFAWQAGEIIIRPAVDERELIREGQLLSHCVSRYAGDVANGKTAIFFIRRAAEPETPWYTLELDEKNLTVRQNRGKKNCGRTPEIEAFEAAWLEWLQEQRAAGKLEAKKKKTTAKKRNTNKEARVA